MCLAYHSLFSGLYLYAGQTVDTLDQQHSIDLSSSPDLLLNQCVSAFTAVC